jgi:hypothetical protein
VHVGARHGPLADEDRGTEVPRATAVPEGVPVERVRKRLREFHFCLFLRLTDEFLKLLGLSQGAYCSIRAGRPPSRPGAPMR